ncbi:YndJ family protein [Chengkuizengella axinellae]|uniref:YndJ family protein n=1 Tax=Chengkuizengella axinellae TaxID=3064388 RepID=A0ABT9IY60_9BACL|nr:YndJ family protein [Chengkuizengella sp. 2205SS18-9]MDP5274248.1 YndJ family protein [Chengkuizengella sp. 2205SS18-9]
MKDILNQKHLPKHLIAGGFLLLFVFLFSNQPWYFHLLTLAQILYVPWMMHTLLPDRSKSSYLFTVVMMISVLTVTINSIYIIDILGASIYLLYTFYVAYCGINRFLSRGFTHWEEIAIDVGMMYLSIGGLWFFASVAGIDTGFTAIITWLTAIHFHYAAFLLTVSIGLFGRFNKLPRTLFPLMLIMPMMQAIGITYFPWLELLSVTLYVGGLYIILWHTFKLKFASQLQKAALIISFGTVCLTIILSLLYVVGNVFGFWNISIQFMLQTHGLGNGIVFGFFTVLSWHFFTPDSLHKPKSFPISKIRGRWHQPQLVEFEKGLVDDMFFYGVSASCPQTIIDFYEQTEQFNLYAKVQWRRWFLPFAYSFKLVSYFIQQLNLPLLKHTVKMEGNIIKVSEHEDGRVKPRAWIRKINNRVVFKAIYSMHKKKEIPYMNIALPLPFSTMVGILSVKEENQTLHLSSIGNVGSDVGIYLAIGNYLMKLPLQEHFIVRESKVGHLEADHKMWIFGLPFMYIHYKIVNINQE